MEFSVNKKVQRMFTPSLNQIDGSPTNKKMKKLFMDWLQNTLGKTTRTTAV
jgi:DNA primase